MTTAPGTCTTPDCNRTAQHYLCPQCTNDLQAWIDKAPGLHADLYDTMAKLDNTRPTNTEGGNGKAITGSPAPINLDAATLRANLEMIAGYTAADYAKDERAAGISATIIDWCTKAELLILGPAEPPIDAVQAAARIRAEVPNIPMNATDLALWIRTVHHIRVFPFHIWKWAERGEITRLTVAGKRTAHYDPGETLAHARAREIEKRGRRP